MPEGPEVRCVAISLHSLLANKSITAIRWDSHSKYTPRDGAKIIFTFPDVSCYLPLDIKGVTCKGKKIVFLLESSQVSDGLLGNEGHDKKSKALYITSTLGTSGRWCLTKSSHTNFWFELSDGTNVYFSDSRHQGNVTFYDTVDKIVESLDLIGPDLLAYALANPPNPTTIPTTIPTTKDSESLLCEYFAKIRRPRLANKQICDFLLDQKYFSGIGNYLKADILYVAKIAPSRTLISLSDENIKLLFSTSLNVILESFQANGLTLRDYWDVYGVKGIYKPKIYGKRVDDLGNIVIKEVYKGNKRTNHWVFQVQV